MLDHVRSQFLLPTSVRSHQPTFLLPVSKGRGPQPQWHQQCLSLGQQLAPLLVAQVVIRCAGLVLELEVFLGRHGNGSPDQPSTCYGSNCGSQSLKGGLIKHRLKSVVTQVSNCDPYTDNVKQHQKGIEATEE